MKNLWKLLVCFSALWAGEHSVSDFSVDQTASVGDTSLLGPLWPNSLQIIAKSNAYSKLLDEDLNEDLLFPRGYNAMVKYSVVNDEFQVAFSKSNISGFTKYVSRRRYAWNSIFFQQQALEDSIAGDQIQSNLGGGQHNESPLKSMDLAIVDSQFVATWGAHNKYPVRWTHDQKLSSPLPNRGLNLDANDSALTENGGIPAVDLAPGNSLTNAYLAYEIGGTGVKQFILRKEVLGGGDTPKIDTLNELNDSRMISLVVRTSSTGNFMVVWLALNDDNLYALAYDNTFSPMLSFAQQAITSTGDMLHRNGVGANDSRMRIFEVASLDDNRFVVVYARTNKNIYYKVIDIVGGSVGPETLVSSGNYAWPSIAVAGKYLAISHVEDLTGSYQLKTKIFTITGAVGSKTFDVNTPFLDTTILDASYTVVTSGEHGIGAPSLAVDTLGSFAVAFNEDNDAHLVAWKNVFFYWDSSFFYSKDLLISTPTVVEPFDPLKDLVQLDSVRFNQDSNIVVRWAQSIDGSYSGTADTLIALDSVGNPLKTIQHNGGHFKYQVHLKNDNFERVTPTVDSLHFYWNVRPRKPIVDSLQIANVWNVFHTDSIYKVMNRRDSVKIRFSIFDFDNPNTTSVVFAEKGVALDTVVVNGGSGSGPGWMTGEFVLPIEKIRVDSMLLEISVFDPAAWRSPLDTITLQFYNSLPQDSIVIKHPENDGIGDFTFAYPTGNPYHINVGDSAFFNLFLEDSNDTKINVTWSNSKGTINQTQQASIGSQFDFTIPPGAVDTNPAVLLPIGQIDLIPDTLTIALADSNDTISYPVILIPNHNPRLDSLKTSGYYYPTNFVDSVVDVLESPRTTKALGIIPFIPNLLRSYHSDVDAINGDQSVVKWGLLETDSLGFCCQILVDSLGNGDSLLLGDDALHRDTLNLGPLQIVGKEKIRDFYEFPPQLWLTTKDRYGAYSQDTILLYYPKLDTASIGQNRFGEALVELATSFDLIIGAQKSKDTVLATVTSTGTTPLRIFDIKTIRDQSKWLKYRLEWRELSGTPQILEVEGGSDVSQIAKENYINLPKGEKLQMRFTVDVASLVGDSIIVDTLIMQTNDFFHKNVLIPIRLTYNDLPTIKVFRMPNTSADTSYTDSHLVKSISMNSKLVFTFSEPVKQDQVHKYIRVYSQRDSVARGLATAPAVQSLFAPQHLKTFPYQAKDGSVFPDYVDSAIFVPNYIVPGDSIDLLPLNQSFVQGDSIHILVNSNITDSTGNPLDLRRTKARMLNFDSIYATRVDTSVLQVDTANLVPKQGGFMEPGASIKIPFDNRLVVNNVFGTDTIRSLDLVHLGVDSNFSVSVTTAFSSWKAVPLKSISLQQGDSVLEFQTKRKFFSGDSVRVIVKSNISDVAGHTLDGDFNGTMNHLYNRKDTADAFIYEFRVKSSGFYTYPNPFKHYREDHLELGGMVFKNLNDLKGAKANTSIDIRIYTITGQLVYSSKRKKSSVKYKEGLAAPEWVWPTTNNSGRKVATGSYLFTIRSGDKVLKKGKVAVLR